MSDHWEFYSTYINDSPAFIFYDHGVQETLRSLATDQCVRFELMYKAPREDGLPTQDEFDVAVEIEDEITAFAAAASGAYAGRVTADGKRCFFAYFDPDEEALNDFLSSLQIKYEYEIRAAAFEDSGKGSYWDLLFPSDEEWEQIQNQKVIENLQKHGDPIEQPRRVDHWAFFDTREDLRSFEQWVSSNGFEIEGVIEPDGENPELGLQFYRTELPQLDAITETTFTLREKARESGGRYDGWETFILNGEES